MPEIFTFFHTAVYYGSCISKENFHPVYSNVAYGATMLLEAADALLVPTELVAVTVNV